MGISHEWNGTILTITSDSGTSSADLQGEKGDTGIRGPQGAPGNVEFSDLTDEQKSALLSDEWIDIADITTTEEVKSVYVDKDINGNAFSCRQIIAKILSPSVLSGGIWTSSTDGAWGNHLYGSNLGWETKEIFIKYNIVVGNFAEWEIYTSPGISTTKEQYFNQKEPGKIATLDDAGYSQPMSGIRVARGYDDLGTDVFPIGTRILIKGVKA